jgi:hypothetical protein
MGEGTVGFDTECSPKLITLFIMFTSNDEKSCKHTNYMPKVKPILCLQIKVFKLLMGIVKANQSPTSIRSRLPLPRCRNIQKFAVDFISLLHF